MARLVIAFMFVALGVGAAQTPPAGEKGKGQEASTAKPPVDPVAQLKQQLTQKENALNACFGMVGEKQVTLETLQKQITSGQVVETRQIQSAFAKQLLDKVEKANKGKYKLDISTGEITLAGDGK